MIITSDMIRKVRSTGADGFRWQYFFCNVFLEFDASAEGLARDDIHYAHGSGHHSISRIDFITAIMPEEIQAEIKQAQITVDKKYANERSRIRRRYAKAIVQWKLDEQAWNHKRSERWSALYSLYDQAYLPSLKELQTKLDEADAAFDLALKGNNRIVLEETRIELVVSRARREHRDNVVRALVSEDMKDEFRESIYYCYTVPNPADAMRKEIDASFINRQNEFASVVANIIDSKYPTFVS